jgi:hypothetical protein
MSPKERFKSEYHNEQFLWGYFAYIAETEEISSDFVESGA